MLISTLHDNLQLLPSSPACIFLLFFRWSFDMLNLMRPSQLAVATVAAATFRLLQQLQESCLHLPLSVCPPVCLFDMYFTAFAASYSHSWCLHRVDRKQIASQASRGQRAGSQASLIPIWLSLLFLPVIFHFYPKEKRIKAWEQRTIEEKTKANSIEYTIEIC